MTSIQPQDPNATPAQAAELDQLGARLHDLLGVCKEIQLAARAGDEATITLMTDGLMDALFNLDQRHLANVASFALNLAAAQQLQMGAEL